MKTIVSHRVTMRIEDEVPVVTVDYDRGTPLSVCETEALLEDLKKVLEMKRQWFGVDGR